MNQSTGDFGVSLAERHDCAHDSGYTVCETPRSRNKHGSDIKGNYLCSSLNKMTAMKCNWKILLIFNILLLADPENSEAKPTPSIVLNGQGKTFVEEIFYLW